MRDNFHSFNMLPIVQDNMNYIPGVRSISLSSNGYYGYQPTLLEKSKKEEPQMPNSMEFESFQENTRKRAWDFSNDFRDFKKRRHSEKITANVKKKTGEELLEELLRETHGCTLYHWICDGL